MLSSLRLNRNYPLSRSIKGMIKPRSCKNQIAKHRDRDR